MMKSKGLMIALEGGDGCGTTTHAALLVDGLRSWLPSVPSHVLDGMGLDGNIHLTRGPSDSDFGKFVRSKYEHGGFRSVRAAAMAFALDRREQYEKEISFLLESGSVVVFDRYVHSSIAHQGMSGAGADFVIACNSDVPKPDVVFHLHAAPRFIARRILERYDDPMSSSESLLEDLEAQQEAWRKSWEASLENGYPHHGFKPYDVDTSLLTVEEVSRKIVAEATARILELCLARNL